MIELLGGVGWGLLACGAITHVWHHRRLRQLIGMHLDRERVPALGLTAIECVLAVALPVALLADHDGLRWAALASLVLALGFVAWIARLLATGSALPCACSFSDAPTTGWSLARACCVALVGLYLLVDVGPDAVATVETNTRVATLAVGWALGAAIFVAPEAISWPRASRALLARVDAHAESATTP